MLKTVSTKTKQARPETRIAIIASRYNARYVDGMLRAAKRVLANAGVSGRHLRVVRVPGAFETPVVAAKLASLEGASGYDAIIGLGVILQGATSHAEHIGTAVTNAFAEIQVRYHVPIIHEVLVFSSVQQARERCLSIDHNRGAEAAQTALEMVRVMGAL